ncbi:MAG: tRNA 2-thiouridine(34) synthase MnmA [Actinomycetota bacterium]
MSKVVVAMSGGVDSSAVAALMVEAGHDVTGIHLRLADAHGEAADGRVHGCCGLTDADDARRVAQVLDIPFYAWSFKGLFAERVVDDLVSSYERGETPNPCVRCNEQIKFGALLERAAQLGFDAVATGHYARRTADGGTARLFRGIDGAKDQSYVLARTTKEQLQMAWFPLGDMVKSETRKIAERAGLRTANKPESYDICFIPDGDTAGFVERSLGGPRPGRIVDPAGNELGEHGGVHRFTIGQRRGLGVGSHERLHVLELDPATATVTVGPPNLLTRRRIVARDPVWTSGEPRGFDQIQVRAHGGIAAVAAWTISEEGRLEIELEDSLKGVSAGQLVACYDGDEVVAGATIDGPAS